MPEMAHSGHDHRQATFVGGSDDVLVLDRATRLDDGACACIGSGE